MLNVDQLFGEVLANVMGDLRIKGSGVFYDIDKFEGPGDEMRQFFGPKAYRYEELEGKEGQFSQTLMTCFSYVPVSVTKLAHPLKVFR